ncbi:hypothetical protein [Vibrio quintilis]|uniref:hypothetical protein n=1 Tax=Vibrio quintilis TaxID=1117707 RepID=UPI00190E7D7B|nr:hypothetical protein [Vibrio quintilis]
MTDNKLDTAHKKAAANANHSYPIHWLPHLQNAKKGFNMPEADKNAKDLFAWLQALM